MQSPAQFIDELQYHPRASHDVSLPIRKSREVRDELPIYGAEFAGDIDQVGKVRCAQAALTNPVCSEPYLTNKVDVHINHSNNSVRPTLVTDTANRMKFF
jgi:hypothetical protein